MGNVCQKCNKEFLTLYKGICHVCWNKSNNYSDTKDKDLKIYRCPACGSVLFKGNVSSLAMTCPKCNEFVKIP